MSTLKVGTIQDHANSNNALVIDSAGRVTAPQTPFLMCDCDGNSANVTPAGLTGKVPLRNVISSRGIVLNTSTNEFTVPVTGLYNVSGAIRLNDNYTYLYWSVGTSAGRLQGDKLILSHGHDGNPGFTTSSGSALFTLETGKDYGIYVNASAGTAVGINNTQSFIDVFLVG